MQLDTLLEADFVTLTCSREPGGKFKVRSGTSSIETVILADQVLKVEFRQGRLHVLRRRKMLDQIDRPTPMKDTIAWDEEDWAPGLSSAATSPVATLRSPAAVRPMTF